MGKRFAKRVEPPFPQSPVPGHPPIEVLKTLRAQRVEPPYAIGPRGNHPGFFQDSQVSGDAGLLDIHAADDGVHRLLAVAQYLDDAESRLVREKLKE
ncbi:MAG TPA: hypothetical protein VEH00_04915 [Steroidobacteraceae bacterium]|nr:hypothetical protein [Steroidobacteraceae bacterium]